MRQGFFRRARRAYTSRTVEDARQPAGVVAVVVEGAAHGGDGLGEREDLARDEQVGILSSHGMPINAFSRDRDFGHRVCARQGDALRRKAAQRDAADNAILFRRSACASRKRRNSSASASVDTVAANRTRNPSPRARSTPAHARAHVPGPRWRSCRSGVGLSRLICSVTRSRGRASEVLPTGVPRTASHW